MDIVFCTTPREDPQYNEDLRKALEADRWVVGLNTGRVLIAPRIVYGMTVRRELPYSEGLRIARALSGNGDRWLVYRYVDEQRNHVACVQVKHARSQATEVLPSLCISREWAEYYSAQWLKALSYWAK